MNRVQHRIKTNRVGKLPAEFLFVDTETHSKTTSEGLLEHKLWFGVCCYWRRRKDGKDLQKWSVFKTRKAFWSIVEGVQSPGRRLVVMAHNLWFDASVLGTFGYLKKQDYKTLKLISVYQRQIWKFAKDRKYLLFLDNMNYFQGSLESLGESVGVPKIKMPPKNAPFESWIEYCNNDVLIMLKSWEKWLAFLKEKDCGCFGLTIASQAFNAFRHRFMNHAIYVHTSLKGIRLERASYRGGRSECFHLGTLPPDHYSLLDINSMYSFVMQYNSFPTNLVTTGKEIGFDSFLSLMDIYHMIADVLIETPEPTYGIKHEGRLTFPVGTFRLTLTHPELLDLLERGKILKVFNYAGYDYDYIFEKYIAFFYRERMEFKRKGEKGFEYLTKLMLNSLYGKFGQKFQDWEFEYADPKAPDGIWLEIDAETGIIKTFRCINGRVESQGVVQEGYNSLVAVAAFVTAYARLYLWDIITRAGVENVFYTDTDSVIVNRAGRHRLRNLIHPGVLGDLKVESSTRKGHIFGLKDYQFGKIRKLKGVSKTAEQLNETTFRQFQSIGFQGSLRRGNLDRTLWRPVDKTYSRQYFKGQQTPSGRVIPFMFEYDSDRSVNVIRFPDPKLFRQESSAEKHG